MPGTPNGDATLDGNGYLPSDQLTPADISNAVGTYAKLVGDTLYNIIDQYTGEWITAKETTEITSDDSVDNIIYYKYGTIYYKRVLGGNIYPEWFGAVGDGTTDDSAAIQLAIDYLTTQNGGKIKLMKKRYIISGKLTLTHDIAIEGNSYSLSQGSSRAGVAITVNISSELAFVPDSSILSTDFIITLAPNCSFNGLALIFPNQSTDNDSQSPTAYPTLFNGANGCSVKNIRTWGAYHFYYQYQVESLFFENIYGYTYGTFIDLRKVVDVCHFKCIHLNPNVIAPSSNIINWVCNNVDSIAFRYDGADGGNFEDLLIYGYKTVIYARSESTDKISGATISRDTGFNLNNFLFDCCSQSFDLQSSRWPFFITNGICVIGAGSENTDSFVLKSSYYSNLTCNIQFKNVYTEIGTWSFGNNTPVNAFISPQSANGADLYYNINLDGSSFTSGYSGNLMDSNTGASFKGTIQYDYHKITLGNSNPNMLFNSSAIVGIDGLIKGWTPYDGSYGTTVSVSNYTNGTRITNVHSSDISSYKGILQTVPLSTTGAQNLTFLVVATEISGTANAFWSLRSSSAELSSGSLSFEKVGNIYIARYFIPNYASWINSNTTYARLTITPTSFEGFITVKYAGIYQDYKDNSIATDAYFRGLPDMHGYGDTANMIAITSYAGTSYNYYNTSLELPVTKTSSGTWVDASGLVRDNSGADGFGVDLVDSASTVRYLKVLSISTSGFVDKSIAIIRFQNYLGNENYVSLSASLDSSNTARVYATVIGQYSQMSSNPNTYDLSFFYNTDYSTSGVLSIYIKIPPRVQLEFFVTSSKFRRYRAYTLISSSSFTESSYNKILLLDNKGIVAGTLKSGTTTNRPTISINNIPIGFQYFDTTLGKPIWLKDSTPTWVDASGTTV